LGLKSMAQVLKPTPVAQVDANGRTQARSGGNCTLGLKSMAQVLKPTPVAQAHSGGTSRRQRSHPSPLRWHKPTLVAILSPLRRQNYSFSLIFSFALAFRKVLFVFCILSPPRVAQSRLLQSHLKSTLRGNLKSTSSVATQSPPCAATKVDFGF
jgi:hypothetical protein